jgi:hypothetical protein
MAQKKRGIPRSGGVNPSVLALQVDRLKSVVDAQSKIIDEQKETIFSLFGRLGERTTNLELAFLGLSYLIENKGVGTMAEVDEILENKREDRRRMEEAELEEDAAREKKAIEMLQENIEDRYFPRDIDDTEEDSAEEAEERTPETEPVEV